MSRERGLQSLPPVQPSAALRAAAQAHAEDMVRAGYFALEGPPGSPTIESLLGKVGYRFSVVTEKLVRAPLWRNVEALIAGWHAQPEANRASLFLADVREIGVGVVESGEQRVIAIVLATSSGPSEAVPANAAALSALAREPAAARTALCAAIAAQRRAWGLSPLRADPSLGEAATHYAEDLLKALLDNRSTREVAPLADRIAEQRAHVNPTVENSGEVSRQRRHAPGGSGVGESVGQVIVTDASSPEEAFSVALRQDVSALRDARYRVVAVGLAVSPPASGHSVWVIALATH
ncbi:MAG TPA: CAP domain-containing protein [Thermoanaerobaculia bacterium]